MESSKEHWDKIYLNKAPNEVSWTQAMPTASLSFIHSFNLPKTARIVDIGGGESRLVDCLLDEGFENITVLDISASALEKTKQRLGEKASKVIWIVSDILDFNPSETYDVWHDRAAFHFLASQENIDAYINIASRAIAPNGYMVLGTFSENGPEKCSGLPVKRYSEALMEKQLQGCFNKIHCIKEDHVTPFNTTQNFLFCGFKKK